MKEKKVTPEVMHLYITSYCGHNCQLCCNKLYDIKDIPVPTVEELSTINTLCITGGEPFSISFDLNLWVKKMKQQYRNIKQTYVYTSGGALFAYRAGDRLNNIDGITFSPKNFDDWFRLIPLLNNDYDGTLRGNDIRNMKSNRLVVFKEQMGNYEDNKALFDELNIKPIYRIWDNKFKTPENEIFRRLPILF